MAIEYNGTPFEYNPTVTNVNIDNQLAGILSQFNDDYIIDVIKDSLQNRFRVYSLPSPNVVAAFESQFKQITDGFSSYTDSIMQTRNRVYKNIIDTICDFYGFVFNEQEGMDYYSAAWSIYEFFVSKFTEYLKTFYSMFMINEKESIYSSMNLAGIRKENDPTFGYSKKLFKDAKIAAIHCNMEYVINQMNTFGITLPMIINYSCTYNPFLGQYLSSLIGDSTNKFFENHYQNFVINSKDSADILTYIKLSFQQMGADVMPIS